MYLREPCSGTVLFSLVSWNVTVSPHVWGGPGHYRDMSSSSPMPRVFADIPFRRGVRNVSIAASACMHIPFPASVIITSLV